MTTSRPLPLAAMIALSLTATAATAAEPAKPKPTISLDVYQADLQHVIRLLADVSGKNVVIPEDVKGKVTLKLTNVPWDAALDTVLSLHDYARVERGNIIRIARRSTLEAESAAALARADAWQKTAPLVTRIIPVSYARAEELVPHIKAVLSERGKVTFDERTNVLIVRDVPGSAALDY